MKIEIRSLHMRFLEKEIERNDITVNLYQEANAILSSCPCRESTNNGNLVHSHDLKGIVHQF